MIKHILELTLELGYNMDTILIRRKEERGVCLL
jgi:hypothetical protein